MRTDSPQRELELTMTERRQIRRRSHSHSARPQSSDAASRFAPKVVDAAFEALSGPALDSHRDTPTRPIALHAAAASPVSTDALLDNLRDQVRALDQQCGQLAHLLSQAQQ